MSFGRMFWKCDECEKEYESGDGRPRLGLSGGPRPSDDPLGRTDFCSWACLSKYATFQAQQKKKSA